MEKNKKSVTLDGQKANGKRIGIFGASGSGKTTKARGIIKSIRRLIVFDSIKQEWLREGKKWLPLFIPVFTIEELKKAILKHWIKGFQIVFVPKIGEEIKQLNDVCMVIWQMQAGYKSCHLAKITLLIDEAQEGVPSGTARDNPKHGALILARMGRDRGVNLIVASQRIKTVDIAIRANLDDIYVFRLSELADINEATQIFYDKKKLLQMANFQYFYKNSVGQVKFF